MNCNILDTNEKFTFPARVGSVKVSVLPSRKGHQSHGFKKDNDRWRKCHGCSRIQLLPEVTKNPIKCHLTANAVMPAALDPSIHGSIRLLSTLILHPGREGGSGCGHGAHPSYRKANRGAQSGRVGSSSQGSNKRTNQAFTPMNNFTIFTCMCMSLDHGRSRSSQRELTPAPGEHVNSTQKRPRIGVEPRAPL